MNKNDFRKCEFKSYPSFIKEYVGELIRLIKEREIYKEGTSNWEECDRMIENQIYLIRKTATDN